jgi:hypothetical protein
MSSGTRASRERGQVLVIVAASMVVIIAMVGLVIDGGFAWGRQRHTQNAADAVAKAGTIVVQHHLAMRGTPNDWDVACAVENAATLNGVDLLSAVYTDFQGAPLPSGAAVGSCGIDPGTPIPLGAQGVKANTSETFDTFLMQAIGFSELTANANATAVVGTPSAVPGGALPVTFPQTSFTCDSSQAEITVRNDDGDGVWEPYELIDRVDADYTNLAILPLCPTAPGSVGWLDFQCGQNLAQSIVDPCSTFIPIPAWVQTQSGFVSSVEDELRAYTGDLVGVAEPEDKVWAVPIHDNTCSDDPDAVLADDPHDPTCDPIDEEWSGEGDNLHYRIPFWIGFKLDAAYTQGADTECVNGPGKPVLVAPHPAGQVSCIKGWFVDRFEEPGPIGLAQINPGDPVAMQIVLIQ